ncbi:hypothetical protein [Mesorhizobium sp. M0898]|uniref:hypothetical protein n=1 Tax=Mesorhizobium sp. M0898 TaxID=2957020 RepID=UPI00333710B6
MFKPWVGDDWGHRDNALQGTRLVVLGESHYCDPAKPEMVGLCEPDVTSYVVRRYAIEEPHRFFTGITQVISGKPKWQMSRDDIAASWHSIAFYNYVPVYVGTEPRIRPGDKFALGRVPFEILLEQLRPEAILVCGYELWWWVLKGRPEGFNGDPASVPFQKIGPAIAARMKHPSTAFSSVRWRPTLLELLSRARTLRQV